MMINKCKLRLTAYTSLQGVLGGLINGGAYIRGELLTGIEIAPRKRL